MQSAPASRDCDSAWCDSFRATSVAGEDDREAAARGLGLVVGDLAAEGGDQPLERLGLVRVLEAHHRRRPQQLAAVVRRHPQAVEAARALLLEQGEALLGREVPEQVGDVARALVGAGADLDQLLVDLLQQPGVLLDHLVRPAQVERADVADGEDVHAHLLGLREDADVEREVQVRLGLGDVAGAAAGGGGHRQQLDVEHRSQVLRGRVELLGAELGDAARGSRRTAWPLDRLLDVLHQRLDFLELLDLVRDRRGRLAVPEHLDARTGTSSGALSGWV